MHQQVCASSLKWFECWQLFFSSFFSFLSQSSKPSSHCPHFSVICSILRLLTCASKWWAPYTPQLQQTCRSQIHLRTSKFPCLIGWIELMAIHVPLLIGQMDEKWKLMYGVIQKVAEFATHHWSNPGISNLQSTVYHIRYDRKIWQCSNTQICVRSFLCKTHKSCWILSTKGSIKKVLSNFGVPTKFNGNSKIPCLQNIPYNKSSCPRINLVFSATRSSSFDGSFGHWSLHPRCCWMRL